MAMASLIPEDSSQFSLQPSRLPRTPRRQQKGYLIEAHSSLFEARAAAAIQKGPSLVPAPPPGQCPPKRGRNRLLEKATEVSIYPPLRGNWSTAVRAVSRTSPEVSLDTTILPEERLRVPPLRLGAKKASSWRPRHRATKPRHVIDFPVQAKYTSRGHSADDARMVTEDCIAGLQSTLSFIRAALATPAESVTTIAGSFQRSSSRQSRSPGDWSERWASENSTPVRFRFRSASTGPNGPEDDGRRSGDQACCIRPAWMQQAFEAPHHLPDVCRLLQAFEDRRLLQAKCSFPQFKKR